MWKLSIISYLVIKHKHWIIFANIGATLDKYTKKIHKQNINNLKLKKNLWSNVKNKCTFTGNNDSKVWPDFFLAIGIQNVCAMIFLLNSLFYMHKTLWPSITWWVPYILQRIDVKAYFIWQLLTKLDLQSMRYFFEIINGHMIYIWLVVECHMVYCYFYDNDIICDCL